MEYSHKTHKEVQQRTVEIFKELKFLIRKGISEKNAKFQIIRFLKNHPEVNRIWHPVVLKFDQSTLNPNWHYSPADKVSFNDIAILNVGVVVDGIECEYADTWSIKENSASEELIQKSKDIMNKLVTIVDKHSASSLYDWLCEEANKVGLKPVTETIGHRIGLYRTDKKIAKIQHNHPMKCFEPGAWMIELHLSDGVHGCFLEEFVWVEGAIKQTSEPAPALAASL